MAAKNTTIKRILKEAAELTTNPSPDFHAAPLEENLFEWHFTIRGPPSPSPFSQGVYHGRIILPPAYPLRPPSFRFLTPSGRFEPNREICLSISGHHEETWQPAWGIRTALVAIRAFMDTDAAGQVGGMSSPDGVRKELAAKSRTFICASCGKTGLSILEEQEARCKELSAEATEEENALVGKIGLVEPKKEDSSQSNSTPHAAGEGAVSTGAARSAVPSQQLPTPAPTPTPTRTTPAPTAQTQAPPPIQRQPPTATDAWIDKAIIGIVIALVLMVLRRIA